MTLRSGRSKAPHPCLLAAKPGRILANLGDLAVWNI